MAETRQEHQLIIIGNGFDLSCGLPSGFLSFFNPRLEKLKKVAMVSVIDKKLVFGRDQVVTSTQASKNFGEARRRARRGPLFVSDRNGGIDTVIVGYDEFEEMAMGLQQLREERLYAVAADRTRKSMPIPTARCLLLGTSWAMSATTS